MIIWYIIIYNIDYIISILYIMIDMIIIKYFKAPVCRF